MIETNTVRIAYSWRTCNQVQVLQYKPRQWKTGIDEDGAFKAACTHLETPGIMPKKEDEQ